MCGATTGGLSREGIDVSKETVIEGTVSKDGVPVTGYVRLLNADGEFTAEVPTSATGAFRFFAAPGSWKPPTKRRDAASFRPRSSPVWPARREPQQPLSEPSPMGSDQEKYWPIGSTFGSCGT